ncbi:DNA-binding transcription factor, zf-fungal binuclear cluster type [Schizosaccharomyces pombe]|uniref:Uncharacterized transcriptional regulatory protein C16G5.17 n=1 Tax=Schizosaccharomyces pombe (strain 972 / ATCC 24843) TaxID=284812 RepID=YH7H_SCHPO|nr:putative transcription factor [Schizosaccharomyces pombe]O60131.1 RecName: Full=Uncharacterized transcriptional regulatory protein C16G5.17 [Schizosaccharomyces pombe 972h-]CAA19036.1 transcription factor, zf-fungal binuclear cluster type (predicted) [Schizosaccharomyces pombe]|eukprot:NP_596766.1 putative transcription factor [Schizosaccharomyces pombe]
MVGKSKNRAHKNIRARSCLRCRRRKVKCDRQYPCSRCKESEESCTYGVNEQAVQLLEEPLSRPITRETDSSAHQETRTRLEENNLPKTQKFGFVDWKTILKSSAEFQGIVQRDPESRLREALETDPKLKKRLECILETIPPWDVCESLLKVYANTFNVTNYILDFEQADKLLSDLKNSNHVFATSIILIVTAIAVALSLESFPSNIERYFSAVNHSAIELSDALNSKIDDFLNEEVIFRLWRNIDRIRLHAIRAQLCMRNQFRSMNTDLCYAIHYACFVNPIFQNTDTEYEANMEVWLSICEIDALECVLRSCQPWVQHDIYGKLLSQRKMGSDVISYEFHSLLGQLLTCGLEIYKAIHTSTVNEFVNSIQFYESQLSLVLMEIESKFSNIDGSDIHFRYLFLKTVFWTVRKNLYQGFITVSRTLVPNYPDIVQKLGQTSIQLSRLISNSMDCFEKYGWLKAMLILVTHTFLIIHVCSERGYDVPKDFWNVTASVQATLEEKKYPGIVWERIHYVLNIYTTINSVEPELSEDHGDLDDQNLFQVFTDIFDFNFNFPLPNL